jgi:hypothetical protein
VPVRFPGVLPMSPDCFVTHVSGPYQIST